MKTLMSYKKGYKPKASELKTGQLAVNFPDHVMMVKWYSWVIYLTLQVKQQRV